LAGLPAQRAGLQWQSLKHAGRWYELLPSDLIGAGMIGLGCVLNSDPKTSAEGWKRAKESNNKWIALDFMTVIKDLLLVTNDE